MAITVLAESRKEAAALVRKVRATSIARVILFVRISSLASAAIEEIRGTPTRVILVAVPTNNPQPAIEAIRLLSEGIVSIDVVASGRPLSAEPVVAAIRAGACDFLEDTASPQELLALIVRLSWHYRIANRLRTLVDRRSPGFPWESAIYQPEVRFDIRAERADYERLFRHQARVLQDRMVRRSRTDRTRKHDVTEWEKVYQEEAQERRLLYQARVLGWGKEKRYYFAHKQS